MAKEKKTIIFIVEGSSDKAALENICMPGIPSEDACFFGGTPRNYALTLQEMFDAARKDGIYPVVREG